MSRFQAVIIASAVAVGALLFILAPALARDPDGLHAGSPHAQWFKNQHNSEGQWCCDESDGHPFFGEYKLNEDGSVSIADEGKTYKLPAYMVLKGGNPTGAAVWWFTTNYHGERTSYCFAPGTLS